MDRLLLQALFGALLLAGVQNPPLQQPQPPGTAPMPTPVDPTTPNAVPGAPPSFVPGVGAGNNEVPSTPRVIRISGGVMTRNLVSKIDPVYPEEARSAHVSGTVVMTARIGKDGHVGNLAVVSGPQMLQAPAIDAVKQWVYRPYLLNGQPVEVSTTVTVNFDPR